MGASQESVIRPLPKGIYTPLPTFFTDDEELDLIAFTKHATFVAKAETVPVVAGSAGEAPHLTASERTQLIEAARNALSLGSLDHVPIVAGVGAPSTRETIALAKDAHAAGADYVMVIPPGYYAGALSPQTERGRESLRRFFVDVAEASPLPVIIYNFPDVSGGIDLDGDLIVDVVKASPNVVGVKLTCASVGKITRINAVVGQEGFKKQYARKNTAVEFLIIDGYIDILLPSVASGAAGAISGLPNIAPRVCVKLWELSSSTTGTAEYMEAQRLQRILALADGYAQKIGFAGLKMLLHCLFGYGEKPRRPLLPMSKEEGSGLLLNEHIAAVLAEEKEVST